jgi:hypothetical protein
MAMRRQRELAAVLRECLDCLQPTINSPELTENDPLPVMGIDLD